MKVCWKKNKNLKPQVILDRIDSIKSVSEDKIVSFHNDAVFEYEQSMAALVNMIDFNMKSGELEKEKILSQAVRRVASETKLNEGLVINEVNELIRKNLDVREYEYRFLSSISVDHTFPIKYREIEECKIWIKNLYPKKYTERNIAIDSHSGIIKDKSSTRYRKLIVSLKSKNFHGAGTKALRSIDLFRAVCCLFANYPISIGGKEWEPINRIRLGSIHTLHKKNGKIATDDIWYEPNFAPAQLCKLQDPDDFLKYYKWVFKKLETISYNGLIKDSLIRYVRALDERDQNIALIKLWGTLETLAAPTEKNYDLITRRCAFLFKETEYHKQILEYLREYRNQSIHSGDQADRVKISCFQLQYYIFYLIRFHLRNAGLYSSIDDANKFLDLSPSLEKLNEKRDMLDRAINFRGVEG